MSKQSKSQAVTVQENIFENSKVRSTFYKGELFFSIIDVIAILTESPTPQTYWDKMKERDLNQLSPFWGRLKLPALDGKMRLTDCANEASVYRIMLYVKSPKADKFKEWVANLVKQELKEIQNPALSIEKGIDRFRKKGKSEQWIKSRIEGIQSRKSYTNTLCNAGLNGQEIGYVTSDLHKGLTGKTPSEHKSILGVKDTPRNHMNFYELNILGMMEYAHQEKIVEDDLKGFTPVKKVLGGVIDMGNDIKNIIERKIGKSISSLP